MRGIPMLLAVVLLAGSVSHGSTKSGELEMPARLRTFLDSGKWDVTPKSFRIIALSFIADGCAEQGVRDAAKKDAAIACIDRCLELAKRTRKARPSLRQPIGEGLWLSHYSLILGARDRLAECANPQEHEAIARALTASTIREPTHQVSSYAKRSFRWPADQTATLASLARFDRAHGAELSEEPVQLWRAAMAQRIDSKLGLPWSEATGRAKGAKLPRGCALSWHTRYLAEFDRELAERWWRAYREHYLVEALGLVGFREWPPGRDLPADVDSGPIVQGVGAAATGLGIAAARAMGDEALALRIEATAELVGAAAGLDPRIEQAATSVLAEAIRFLGAQVRPR